MIRNTLVCLIVVSLSLAACTRKLSPEERARVQALQTELQATKNEISETQLEMDQYSGGLIKALMALRLEILKTNEALIQQRIHAIESGAKVKVETVATKPDPERAKQLEAELAKQELKVSEAEAKISIYSGGLIGAMAVMGAATERNSLAMLRQQYLIAKHGLLYPGQTPTRLAAAQEAKAAPGRGSTSPAAHNADEKLRDQVLDVTLLRSSLRSRTTKTMCFLI